MGRLCMIGKNLFTTKYKKLLSFPPPSGAEELVARGYLPLATREKRRAPHTPPFPPPQNFSTIRFRRWMLPEPCTTNSFHDSRSDFAYNLGQEEGGGVSMCVCVWGGGGG
jgi:hypothetical protein